MKKKTLAKIKVNIKEDSSEWMKRVNNPDFLKAAFEQDDKEEFEKTIKVLAKR